MPKNISSENVAWILGQIGIALTRRGKEDIYTGEYEGKRRVVVVPRRKRSIPQGTLGSIWRQAGISPEKVEEIWRKR